MKGHIETTAGGVVDAVGHIVEEFMHGRVNRPVTWDQFAARQLARVRGLAQTSGTFPELTKPGRKPKKGKK